MRRHSLLVSVIVAVFMLAGAPAALADVGGKDVGNARADHPVHGVGGKDVGVAGADHPGNGPSVNGTEHALAGSANGMNRPGEPGSWKGNGHEPSPTSFPQGHSPSDPDADGNGGQDKPGGAGGFDDDKDGNNGCGNDRDREDDNNGWCGNKPKAERPPPPVVEPPGPPPPAPPPPSVIPPPPVVIPPPVPPTRPDDEIEVKETPPLGPLPETGADITTLMFAGTGMLMAGVGFRGRRRRA